MGWNLNFATLKSIPLAFRFNATFAFFSKAG